jgi:4-aminobutyrate aminotransferase
MKCKTGEKCVLNQERMKKFEQEGRIEKPGENLAADHNFFKHDPGFLDIVSPKTREIVGQDCNIVSACAARPYPLVVDGQKVP